MLAYVCIDFGFWRKIFGFEDEAERIWRAGVEATLGATLIIFLFAYLNLAALAHPVFAYRGGLAPVDGRGRGAVDL